MPAYCLFSPTTVFLVGMRASGKTTLGRALAAHLGYAFVDTDEVIQEESGLSVQEIVAREGWHGFRARENNVLRCAARESTVVATGGGVVLKPENRDFLRQSGLCIYLATDSDVLANRLRLDPKPGQRPSLTDPDCPAEDTQVDEADQRMEIESILRERRALYLEVAHHVLDADAQPPELVTRIAALAAFVSDTPEKIS